MTCSTLRRSPDVALGFPPLRYHERGRVIRAQTFKTVCDAINIVRHIVYYIVHLAAEDRIGSKVPKRGNFHTRAGGVTISGANSEREAMECSLVLSVEE
jgi:hypothetical protein